MLIRWDNPDQTYVRVEVAGNVHFIPAVDEHPDWKNIKAMIEAGALVVSPYEPPAPASPDIQG